MTNKEWLSTLPNEEIAYLFTEGMKKYASQSTQSMSAIIEWLKEEHTENDYVEKYCLMRSPTYGYRLNEKGEFEEYIIQQPTPYYEEQNLR